MKILEYEDKYIEDVRNLLVELEEYIVDIDKDNLDHVGKEYREKYLNVVKEKVSKNNGIIYIAVEDKKAIGLVVGTIRVFDEEDYLDYKCPKTGIIEELIVSKNVRAKGIGKLLMEKIEKYFKDKKCEYSYLDVFAYNENAINFYDRNGYHERMHSLIKKID